MPTSLKASILQLIKTSGPDSIMCPLTMEIMRDPVFTTDGHCYERTAIETWLISNDTSPLTGVTLESKMLVPAFALRSSIDDWKKTVLKHIPYSNLSMRTEIGRGKHKITFKAQLQGQMVAAVKIIDSTRYELFARKILAWSKIPPHPRLVRLIGVSLDSEQELVVMEMAPYRTLPEMLEGIGSMPMPHKLVVLQQVCAGMEALVSTGFVHGQLALHTVLTFRYDATNAALTSVKLHNLCVSADDAETARWAAPERLRVPPTPADQCSDVWSFGMLAWELLSDGRTPYPAVADSQVTARVLAGERPSRVAGCTDALWSTVTACWADRAADRPSFEILAVALCTVDVCSSPLAVDPLHSVSCCLAQRSLDHLAQAVSARLSNADAGCSTRLDGQASTAAVVRTGARALTHALQSLMERCCTASGGASARNGLKLISQPSVADKEPIACLQASMSMESALASPVARDDVQTLSKPSPSTPKSSAGKKVAVETKQRRGGRPANRHPPPPQRSAAKDAADPDFRNSGGGMVGDKAGSRAGERKRGGWDLALLCAVPALAVACVLGATLTLEPQPLVENDFRVKSHRVFNGGTHVDIATEICVKDSEDVALKFAVSKDITKEANEDIVRPYVAARNDSPTVACMLIAAETSVESKVQRIGLSSLVAASWWGLTQVLEQPLHASEAATECSTYLQLASSKGNAEEVDWLLAACATFDPAFKDGWTPLFLAAAKGHVAVADRLILAGAEVDQIASIGINPLHIACAYGHLEVVDLLIAAHADVNALSDDGNTPLIFVSTLGNSKVVARLLAARAAVDSANKKGVTPLYAAAKTGHASVACMLITAGADVHRPAGESGTPLYGASAKGHLEIMDMLIGAGADVNAETPSGWTPLHTASWNGHAEAVELLLAAQANVNATTEEGASALSLAAHKNHSAVAIRLIMAMADVQSKFHNGNTALGIAAHKGHAEMVRLLIAARARINAKSKKGHTALFLASEYGSLEVVELLVAARAKINIKDKRGSTALSIAALKGHLDVVVRLLGAGAHVNTVDADQRTPLHEAAYAGHDTVVKVLLAAGAGARSRDAEGNTPADLARHQGQTEVAALLATHETGAVEDIEGDGMQGEGPERKERGRAA